MKKIPVGLAIILIFEEFNKSCISTLKKIAEIGYKGIETTGSSPIAIKEFIKVLNDLGLEVTSTHVSIEELKSDFNKYIEFNKAVNCKYMVIPSLMDQNRSNLKESDFLESAHLLNKYGVKCKESGVQLCYHNHNHEFTRVNGKYGLDIMYEETNKDLVSAELDTYWIKYGGANPVEYVKKYKNRLPLIHFKDMEAGEKHRIIEIGEGILDFKAILNAADLECLKWILVEQDSSRREPFESIKISFNNLKRMGIA